MTAAIGTVMKTAIWIAIEMAMGTVVVTVAKRTDTRLDCGQGVDAVDQIVCQMRCPRRHV